MEELYMMYLSGLRERAARCRELARGARASGIACELESIAQEYERDADRIETQISSTHEVSIFGSG